MAVSIEASLPYHEPPITTIAILSGFLLLLSLINYSLDKIAHRGLIGQIALGIAWGTPGAKWLSREIQDAVVQLGYLGLILLVFEGGLSTSFRSLRANLGLSSIVASTGILLPIGLSFAVRYMLKATPLQAFAAGAALCSTSLGTTLTILGTSGLSATRLGVVLTSAAMMDDVVGLIMVQVISNLGGDNFNAITVVRPILVSLGFAVVIPFLCRFIILPVTIRLNAFRQANPNSQISKLFSMRHTAFLIHTSYLLGIVVGATFAGTSSPLAAYIAGATIGWWDSEAPHLEAEERYTIETNEVAETSVIEDTRAPGLAPERRPLPKVMEGGSGAEIFHQFYEPVLDRTLKPFFFASIGFSIPITKLFIGPIIWRGVISTILMILAKLACGLWLMSFTNPFHGRSKANQRFTSKLKRPSKTMVPGAQCTDSPLPAASSHNTTTAEHGEGHDSVPLEPLSDPDCQVSPQVRNSAPKPEKAISLYPACIVGIGMVARGEIGYLVSALAESKGIFGASADGQSSELFLIVTWAITLCTIIGPISVGLIVNRVRKLEDGSQKATGDGKRNVLGAWGVN